MRAHQPYGCFRLHNGWPWQAVDRDDLCDRLIAVAAHNARAEAVTYDDTADAVTADGCPILWAVTGRARSASGMAHRRRLLRQAMVTIF